jgi:hypothetical protein
MILTHEQAAELRRHVASAIFLVALAGFSLGALVMTLPCRTVCA